VSYVQKKEKKQLHMPKVQPASCVCFVSHHITPKKMK